MNISGKKSPDQLTLDYLTPRANSVALDLEALLPVLAPRLIEPTELNARFLNDPDNVAEHHLDWHQYGIITHTKNVRAAYRDELFAILKAWQLD